MKELSEFEQRLAQIHLDLYHLTLDIDTTCCQAHGCTDILKAFEEAWDKIKWCEGLDNEVD